MVFGKDRNKGIKLNGFRPEVVDIEHELDIDDLVVHDATSQQLAFLISSMEFPAYPAPMGIIRDAPKQDYSTGLMEQVAQAQESKGAGDLNQLYRSSDLWTVTAREEEETQVEVAGAIPLALDDEYMDTMDTPAGTTSAIQDRLTESTIAALEPNVPITINSTTSLAQATRQMNNHNIGCLLVTDESKKLSGIFTERDVLMRVAGVVDDLGQASITDYMTPDPISVKGDLPIAHAVHLMSVHGFRHLPIVNEQNQPEGIISFRDVVEYLNEQLG